MMAIDGRPATSGRVERRDQSLPGLGPSEQPSREFQSRITGSARLNAHRDLAVGNDAAAAEDRSAGIGLEPGSRRYAVGWCVGGGGQPEPLERPAARRDPQRRGEPKNRPVA